MAYISVVHGFIHTIEITYAVLLLRIGDEFGAGLFVLGIVANAAAFTFGFGALFSGRARFDLGFEVGSRGDLETADVEESFLAGSFTFSISQ